MKALIYEGPKLMYIREHKKPEPQNDEVLIRIARVGICGSELSGYLGHNSLRKPPLIMGHEFSGTIEQVGHDVTSLKVGDRVTANPLATCGSCRECRNGKSQLCAHRKLIGAHLPGAFADYVVVLAKNTYVLDDHVTFDEGAFTEPFACAVHICNLLKLTPNHRMLIIGAGPIGLFVLQAAQVYGLQDITVIDINEERLEIARALKGITATSLEALSNGLAGPFDSAVDAVGLEITRMSCVDSVKPGGSVIFTGLHEESTRLPINYLIRNEINTIGAFAYSQDDFETSLNWISQGKASLNQWITYAPLEEGGACFEKLISNPGKIAKIILTLD
jgi:2-desacetyl-2-hydroxyethyl bacteriochlorophyllide A dehydrogenase